MPALPITTSSNISSLNSKIVGDLCGGNFFVDITPSVFISSGASNVLGASIRITNPVGVIIKDYPSSSFDILPPMTSVVTIPIPLIAGNYQYGTYTIAVRLTDAGGTQYTVAKSVNICPPDPNNTTRKYGCLNMSINGNCKSGEVVFLLNNPTNYKGTTWTSQVNALTIKYPTASGKTDFNTTLGSFSLQLYEGQYQVSGTVCALYNYGDEVYFKVNYKVKSEKTIKCIIDECCVQSKWEELALRLDSDCTQGEKDNTMAIIIESQFYFSAAKGAANCGTDPSLWITKLEEILGCQCTCNCNEGTPIIGNYSSNLFLYKAILTQVSTAIPTAIKSSLNQADITWTRTSAGLYTGTLTGTYTPLTANNTFIITGSGAPYGSTVDAYFATASTILIKTANASGVLSDDILSNTPLQITILG